jgi:hypothetical protein
MTKLCKARIATAMVFTLLLSSLVFQVTPTFAAGHNSIWNNASAAHHGSLGAMDLGPTLSVSSNLTNRRYVAAGDRAYELGSEDGRYPAMGFHTRGEMGGIWSPPIKLLDGIWFGINGQWIGPATSFTSGFGYVQMVLPAIHGLHITRTDFVPDGRRAVEFGLTLTASNSAPFTLDVDAHSELMSAYPWGFTTPNQLQFNLPDTASFNGTQLVFQENGTPPVANATPHDWAAVVGATSLTPASGTTNSDFRGPQDPPVICPASGADLFRCDDTGFGKGAGGELTYNLKLHAKTSTTIWFTVAGSDQGLGAAQAEYQAASTNPAGEFLAKVAARLALDSQTQVTLSGDPMLAAAVAWSKQNLADLTQQADNLNIRRTEEGTVYPPPAGFLPSIRFEGAGFPDYPWMFATDQEYTMFALLAAGQFATAEAGLRSLAAVSDIANNSSGKVVHETVTDGSVYFGLNDESGDLDETAKFPTAVAMVWRWTGDSKFRDDLYDFSKRNMQYLVNLTNSDDDLWPDGGGNVESNVLGADAVDVSVYLIRGLLDLADMAASKQDIATENWAIQHATALEQAFQGAWWLPNIPQYADSLNDPNNQPLMQRWWTGVTPMEAELYPNGVPQPGLAPASDALPALKLRETSCYSGTYGLYVEGGPGCDPGTYTGKTQQAYTLNTGVMAVGLGNYGLLGPNDQQRYTDDLAQLQLGPVEEQPGMMPEIGPSPDFAANVTQPFNERSSLEQAWGTYGVLWPVVHQQLGVDPQIGDGLLEVLPNVPPDQSMISGTAIRVGSGTIDVMATHNGNTWTTTLTSRLTCSLHVGVTLPAGSTVTSVMLNGSPTAYQVRDNNSGRQVYVSTSCGSTDQVTVVAH